MDASGKNSKATSRRLRYGMSKESTVELLVLQKENEAAAFMAKRNKRTAIKELQGLQSAERFIQSPSAGS